MKSTLYILFNLYLFVIVYSKITVEINDKRTCSFSILMEDSIWLNSTDTFIYYNKKYLNAASGKLEFIDFKLLKGFNKLGNYQYYQFTYSIPNTNYTIINTINMYENLLTFEQSFPNYIDKTSTGNSELTITGFPNFINTQDESNIGWVQWLSFDGSYSWQPTGTYNKNTKFSGGIRGTGVISLFSTSNSLILSPLDNFMAVSTTSPLNGSLQFGVMGNVTSIPSNSKFSFIIVPGTGINNAMKNWGDVMRNYHGKPYLKISRVRDYTLQYLGYSTDNGAYYYYNTEKNKTYQDTLLDVYDESDLLSLPYRYILLDSWWYYKGSQGGVSNWTAITGEFPQGLQWFFNQTGWFIQAHNKYWDNDNIYAIQNGGKFNFVEDEYGRGMLPDDSALWEFLFSESSNWGLKVYEQDWLHIQTLNKTEQLLTTTSLGLTWLNQMNNAALENGICIQYCMAFGRHILQSLSELAVTQARASGDHTFAKGNPNFIYNNWIVGGQSILFDAVGIASSKDVFWTSTWQAGNPYGDNTGEFYPRLESASATFSAGPVQIGDGLGFTNISIVMLSCAASGLLLQPDSPSKTIDRVFASRAFNTDDVNGEIWTSFSTISGLPTLYMFAASIVQGGNIKPTDFNYDNLSFSKFRYFEFNSTQNIGYFSSNSPILLPVYPLGNGFFVYTIVPILSNGMSLLGERNKWVAVSSTRFTQVAYDATSIEVVVVGTFNETITIGFCDSNDTTIDVTCTFGLTNILKITSNGACFDY